MCTTSYMWHDPKLACHLRQRQVAFPNVNQIMRIQETPSLWSQIRKQSSGHITESETTIISFFLCQFRAKSPPPKANQNTTTELCAALATGDQKPGLEDIILAMKLPHLCTQPSSFRLQMPNFFFFFFFKCRKALIPSNRYCIFKIGIVLGSYYEHN